MRLHEWQEANPDVLVQAIGTDGALQVFTTRPVVAAMSKRCVDLYHLSDYVVSSAVSGPSLILAPRTERS